jgi:hypothetical protein
VIDEATLAQINGKYVLPPDAGPAWRAAYEAGLDMSLVEETLRLTPEQRLAEHQQVIDFLLEIQAAGHSHGPDLSLDGLIEAKKAAGRERDLFALRYLLAIKERGTQD